MLFGKGTFLGKPIDYWLELDNYIEQNMYESLVMENAKLRIEVQRLHAIEKQYKFNLDVMKNLGMSIEE